MEAIHVETVIGKGGTLTLTGLPLQEGAVVDVSVALRMALVQAASSHPLEGLPITYIDPFEPAAPPEDWEVLNDRS